MLDDFIRSCYYCQVCPLVSALAASLFAGWPPQTLGGETVRKLKIKQSEQQNIATDNMNNNKMMWSKNLKKEFSDSLGGFTRKGCGRKRNDR